MKRVTMMTTVIKLQYSYDFIFTPQLILIKLSLFWRNAIEVHILIIGIVVSMCEHYLQTHHISFIFFQDPSSSFQK